jgi:hypothetical protein
LRRMRYRVPTAASGQLIRMESRHEIDRVGGCSEHTA